MGECWKIVVLAAGFCAAFAACAGSPAQCGGRSEGLSLLRQTDVWVSGRDGYHTYRIPAAILTARGTLLAFCEGRRSSASDTGYIDLLVKRSVDGGATWSPQRIVWRDAGNTCGNPCVVQDGVTGAVILLMTHNLGNDPETDIRAGSSRASRTVWITRSTDDGLTWSAPQEITRDVKAEDWGWYATGPGVGIQITRGPHKGRLVIPCDHTVIGEHRSRAHVILSDNHGLTWRIGGIAAPETNECQVVELSGGVLCLNARNYAPRALCRAICFSEDGGETWKDFSQDAALPEPVCQASILRWSWPDGTGPGCITFSNPASKTSRACMTVRLSRDGGRSWPQSCVVNRGPSAYSCLVALPGGGLGCLYECGAQSPYQKITLGVLDGPRRQFSR